MKKRINIAELLKDCPKGMELDCTMFENVTLVRVDMNKRQFPIEIAVSGVRSKYLSKEGCFHDTTLSPESKCVIFPKGKTTWDGFVPPCPFKDGDILYAIDEGNEYIFIFKEVYENERVYCHLNLKGNNLRIQEVWITDYNPTTHRLATEEEKQKLFDAIKATGYKWNEENKTLEKLVEPIEDKGNISDGYHTFNELYEYRLLYNASMFNELAKQGLYDVHKSKRHSDGTIPFGDENWFIVQAELPTGQISNHYEMKDWELFNIPEKEKANHYDGHTPQDVAKRLRDFLSLKKYIVPKFKVGDYVAKKDGISVPVLITNVGDEFYYSNTEKSVGVFSIQEQDDWVLVTNKFDITTLKPFDKVLVRETKEQVWVADLFSNAYNGLFRGYIFTCVGHYPNQCIPYEGNEHLLGTTNDCDEHFKTWER